jgi:hypothetical protein
MPARRNTCILVLFLRNLNSAGSKNSKEIMSNLCNKVIVLFINRSAGRRGFSTLGAVWKKMRIAFQLNGKFDKAASYTTV